MAIHVFPTPKAYTDAGRPISTQALMSDAPADRADTQGPIFLPPRK